MAEKVDMSLDDIIAMTKKQRRCAAGGGDRGRSGTRGGGGGARRGAGSPRGGRKGRGDGGKVQKPRPGLFRRTRRLNDDALRENDMYNGGRGKPQISQPYNSKTTGVRLMVSNLHPVVNDEDIRGLFAEFGPLKRSSVNYDKNGKSRGTAEVVFERRSDALEAMKQYNKVPLDGLPMQIELTGGPGEMNDLSQNSARRHNNRSQYNDQDRPVRRGGGGGWDRGRDCRNERNVLTAMELKAQLEACGGSMLTLEGLEVFGN